MMKRLNSIRITVRKKRLPINDRRLFIADTRRKTKYGTRENRGKPGKDEENAGKLYKYINLLEKRARAL